MFDSKQTLIRTLADTVDLMIDFATLGEYGLEPATRPTSNCEIRHRPAPIARRQQCRPGAPTLVLSSEKPASRRRHPIDGPFLLRP